MGAYTDTVCVGKPGYTVPAIPFTIARSDTIPVGYGETIARLRKAQKLTQAELGELVGVEQPTVQRWEANKREPDLDTLSSLADALGVEPGAFFIDDVAVPTGPKLFVKGAVQAGQWVEAYEWPEQDWQTFNGRPRVSARMEHRFGLRVVGESMNLKYPNGSIVECISVFGHVEAYVGRRVVVVRKREDQLYEATVKKLVEQDGELWAVPESTNPAFMPIRLSAAESGILETRIAAVVVRAIIDED